MEQVMSEMQNGIKIIMNHFYRFSFTAKEHRVQSCEKRFLAYAHKMLPFSQSFPLLQFCALLFACSNLAIPFSTYFRPYKRMRWRHFKWSNNMLYVDSQETAQFQIQNNKHRRSLALRLFLVIIITRRILCVAWVEIENRVEFT